MKKDSVARALAPLEFIVTVSGALLLFVLALGTVAALLGSGSIFGLGHQAITCVEVPANPVPMSGISDAVGGLHHNADATATQIRVCARGSSLKQQLLGAGTMLPEALFALGFLGQAWLLLRRARRHGLFVRDIATGTSRLGWYLLAGTVTVGLLQGAASARLLSTMVTVRFSDQFLSFPTFLSFVHISWALLIAGFGAITVGRALARAVPMQQELDATV